MLIEYKPDLERFVVF